MIWKTRNFSFKFFPNVTSLVLSLSLSSCSPLSCSSSSIFWALKLIFLIIAFEDPECAPCPIAWESTMAPTAEDVKAAPFRAPEMAASGASARVDCVEVVLPRYTMKPNSLGIRYADGGCLFFILTFVQIVCCVLEYAKFLCMVIGRESAPYSLERLQSPTLCH